MLPGDRVLQVLPLKYTAKPPGCKLGGNIQGVLLQFTPLYYFKDVTLEPPGFFYVSKIIQGNFRVCQL